MDLAPSNYGTGRDYTACITNLSSNVSNFLDFCRGLNTKFITDQAEPRLTKALKLVQATELSAVKNLEPDIIELDKELSALVAKFQIIQRSYMNDSSLTNFFGSFGKTPDDAFKKLLMFVDDSIGKVDSVITAYSKIDRNKVSANRWIATIKSPEHTATRATYKKAQEAEKTLKELDSVIGDVREICHSTKVGLLGIRNVAAKYQPGAKQGSTTRTFDFTKVQ